uniref:Uncharacterized protein n=1 Tax=Panstrongylus lignarius TaxID=156445 RepID=A0A224XSH3_9HEMI
MPIRSWYSFTCLTISSLSLESSTLCCASSSAYCTFNLSTWFSKSRALWLAKLFSVSAAANLLFRSLIFEFKSFISFVVNENA